MYTRFYGRPNPDDINTAISNQRAPFSFPTAAARCGTRGTFSDSRLTPTGRRQQDALHLPPNSYKAMFPGDLHICILPTDEKPSLTLSPAEKSINQSHSTSNALSLEYNRLQCTRSQRKPKSTKLVGEPVSYSTSLFETGALDIDYDLLPNALPLQFVPQRSHQRALYKADKTVTTQ